jgi:hypothetical protein
VQNVCDGDTASEVAVDVDVIGIEDVRDIRYGGDGNAAFIHAAVNGDVRVAIDDAGYDELARGVENLGILRRLDRLAHLGDFSILNKDRAFLNGAVRNGENCGVLNQNHRLRIGWIGGASEEWKHERAQEAKHGSADTYFGWHGWNPHSAPPVSDESLLLRV